MINLPLKPHQDKCQKVKFTDVQDQRHSQIESIVQWLIQYENNLDLVYMRTKMKLQGDNDHYFNKLCFYVFGVLVKSFAY